MTGLFLAFVLVTAAGAHVMAARRVASGDCGGFWAQVLERLAIWFGVPLLLISALHTAAPAWMPSKPEVWLAITGAVWVVLLAMALAKPPLPEDGRWIAGTLDFSPYRYWVLAFTLPFLPVLFRNSGAWSDGVFAAQWGVAVAFVVALGGVAVSANPAQPWSAASSSFLTTPPARVELSPWPDEMQSRGIALRKVMEWEAPGQIEEGTGGEDWHRRLEFAGSPGVSRTLCGAVAGLVGSAPVSIERNAVVLAPDHCGQEEVVALAATELTRRYGEATLVITAGPRPALGRELTRWLGRLGGESPARLADLSRGDSSDADLLLVDAETLSDSLLDKLRVSLQQEAAGAPLLTRIGLVVWWDAHEFSGVLAAHVWAVSRRLERLLRWRRGLPPRGLVLARRAADREGQFLAFLEHLLPYAWKKENEFEVATEFARHTTLYRLEDASPATAAEASLISDWPTLPAEATLERMPESRAIAESAASAGAEILDIRPTEFLSLREMICRGGRSSPEGIPHHVALAAPENPYVDFLLSEYAGSSDAGGSVQLLAAEGHPQLVRRHLLLALREAPDALTGLRSTFHWEEAMLRDALQQLSAENRLSRVPVRFLDSEGRLQRDSIYTSQTPGQEAVRSFGIVGGDAVPLRDPNVAEGLLLEVDRERLAIDAYPLRVFESGGRRYRIQPWPSSRPKWIACSPEQNDVGTWRFATGRITSLKRSRESLTTRGLERYHARVQYREDVTDILERDAAGKFRTVGIDAVRTNFETEALILEFTGKAPEWSELVSAAAALRHSLPVHTGLDQDVLEAIPFELGGKSGIALVDLYPGGIGLAGAIHKALWLVPLLFDRTARWIAQYQGPGGDRAIAGSPLIRTLGISRLNVQGALRLFAAAGL